jgi:hemin uptake protein HemP
MPDNSSRSDPTAVAQPIGRSPRMISSRELFGDDKLLIIRHDKDDYRLQVTATGKLILTK